MRRLYPRCALALAGILVSNALFVLSAITLYWLGCLVLKDGELSRRAVLLFCFNPASAFYSAAYSESLFTFLTFSGALYLSADCPGACRTKLTITASGAIGTGTAATAASIASATAAANGAAVAATVAGAHGLSLLQTVSVRKTHARERKSHTAIR